MAEIKLIKYANIFPMKTVILTEEEFKRLMQSVENDNEWLHKPQHCAEESILISLKNKLKELL